MSYYYYEKSFDLWTDPLTGPQTTLGDPLVKLLKVIVHAKQDFGICFNYSLQLGYSTLHFLSFKWLLDWYFPPCLGMLNYRLKSLASILLFNYGIFFFGTLVLYFAVLAIAWSMYIFIHQN